MEKARQAVIRVRRLGSASMLVLDLIQKNKVEGVQAVALYGAQLKWCRQKGLCKNNQKQANRKGRTTTGMLQYASIGVVVWKAGLQPVVSVLNKWQRRYSLKLLAAPQTEHTRDILPVSLREGEEQAHT